ncbi:MAG: DEAD/SNF2-like helicase [Hyperionvirus sp.]|uniref:DEAD/SNF2-like helicase n=1 Tax=Hyperionvirus sp. TaxID=2487770 RepID=A0A3G5AGC0_9VIRU|nr:MAG: DEAD/SNF2-like helicase [Hyperionvirus sp.]
MSVEVDGWTILFYDKYAGGHNYDNNFTVRVKLEDLLSSDNVQLTGNDAIAEFNKFGGFYLLPGDLDQSLYQISMYVTEYGGSHNNVAKYTTVGVNNALLKQYVVEKKPIPNESFLVAVCRYHNSYCKASQTGNIGAARINDTVDILSTEIINKIKATTGDVVDPMIPDPDFLNCQLFEYQKRSVHWMAQREKDMKQVIFNINDEVIMGDIFFDAMRQTFTLGNDRKQITFCGGALIDEVGLGKTVQMTTLALSNPAIDLSYIRAGVNRLHSRASLVLCPNQLCGQWKRELEKMVKDDLKIIPLLTKVHFDKYTYQDLLDADFVIVSYNFFDNKAFHGKWMKQVSTNGSYHKSPPAVFSLASVKTVFEKMGADLVKDPTSIFQKGPLLPLIKWHRVIIDEFHEIYTVLKYSYMVNLLPTIEGKFRWCVTGTPFDKSSVCLVKMMDYVTNYSNPYADKVLTIKLVADYLRSTFFRRNTKKSVMEEYQLPPLKESVVWLKFTQTERMMYNAYLANPNNDKYSIFLRQLCCHPKLAEETKDLLSNCKTLEDIEKMMVLHYEQAMKKAQKLVDYFVGRVKMSERKIKRIEFRRQRKFLMQLGFEVEIKGDDEKEGVVEAGVDIADDIGMYLVDGEDGEEDELMVMPKKGGVGSGKKIVVSDETQDEILKLVGNMLKNNKSKSIQNIRDYIGQINVKLKDAQKDLDGRKTTYDFYKNVFDRIRKTATDENKGKGNDDETCGICLTEIPENDIGVTKCGHIYCYQCIKTIISQRHECPYCRKNVKENEVFMISYERKSKIVEQSQEIKNKMSLINEVGTKLANIIYYLKGSGSHVIIFSQWDDLLRKIGGILDNYGIKNVFCRGNVWQRDKAIRMFNTDPKMRVIMLSSESAASGTNLTKANKVIIVDPVCGTYEYRKNTEGQAIGRAHRMGQQNEVEVLRFVVNDTIEQEIYSANKEEDKKHVVNTKIFESTDDSITLTDDKLNELSTSVMESKNKKKKILVRGKKVKEAEPDLEDEDL